MPHLRTMLASGLALLLALLPAGTAWAEDLCAPSPEEAAVRFVQLSTTDARRAAELIEPRSLAPFKQRLAQLMDARYSPDSEAFRERLLGPGWTAQRMAAATDKELVGQFLAGGQALRRDWKISNVRAIDSQRGLLDGREVTVSYQVESPTLGSSTQKRTFAAHPSPGNKCWLVQMPTESRVRLDEIAQALKASRPQVDIARAGPARADWLVAPASYTPKPGMKELARSGEAGSSSPAWVDTAAPLLTAKDLVGARAAWDCEASFAGPEDPAIWLTLSAGGSNTLTEWTRAHHGAILAMVVNGQVAVIARVAGVLGSKLQMCLPGASLEQAQALANDLMGAPR